MGKELDAYSTWWEVLTDEEKTRLMLQHDRSMGGDTRVRFVRSSTPARLEVREAFTTFFELSTLDRCEVRDWYEREMKERGLWSSLAQTDEEYSWVLRASVSRQEAMLVAASVLQADGKDSLRVGQVIALTDNWGRRITNPAEILRQLSKKDPPLVEITSESTGPNGLGFKLLAAGLEAARFVKARETHTKG